MNPNRKYEGRRQVRPLFLARPAQIAEPEIATAQGVDVIDRFAPAE